MDDLSTVLLIEDNPDDAELINYAFKKAAIVNPLIVVDDGDKAIDYLHGSSAYADRAGQREHGLRLCQRDLLRCAVSSHDRGAESHGRERRPQAQSDATGRDESAHHSLHDPG